MFNEIIQEQRTNAYNSIYMKYFKLANEGKENTVEAIRSWVEEAEGAIV